MNAPLQQTAIAAGAVDSAIAAETLNDFDRLLRQEYSPRDMLEGDGMDKMMRLAEQMATSRVSVPEHLRGNVGDCLAIVTQAMLWNMNPFAVAQKTHIVSGRLGYEAQLVNAVVQNSGAVISSPRYEYKGEGEQLECRVGFIERGQIAITWGEFLRLNAVTTRNSPLWKTNPKQQLGYLQIKNWARAFCPGAILGVYSVDELEEIPEAIARGPRRKSAAANDAPGTGERVDGDGVIHTRASEMKVVARAPAAAATGAVPAPAPAVTATTQGTARSISGGQVAYLRNKLKAAEVAEQTICDRFQATSIELLTAEQFDLVKSELLAMA